eukprot:TRINITY_DN7906_c0_g1_i2.p1 TRINITY_DN7906_c0_g1~~TRINITY_DN7906_c0_g1_i2.p1  ORF type:complete len:631 (+),score=152.93 TRINITY_DN7906_c0_g1_i2:31-1893(+)
MESFALPKTDIYRACREGNLNRVIECFYEEEANLFEPDESSRTPLYYAAMCGHEDIVDWLLARGCAPSRLDILSALTDSIIRKLKIISKPRAWRVRAAPAQPKQPEAVVIIQEDPTEKLLEEIKKADASLSKIQYWVEKGANIEYCDPKEGVPLIAYAHRNENDEIVKYLAKKGAKTLAIQISDTCNKESYFSDLAFTFPFTEKKLFGHQLILKNRCPAFLNSMIADSFGAEAPEESENEQTEGKAEEKPKAKKTDTQIQEFRVTWIGYQMAFFLLKYFYRDCIFEEDWKQLNPDEIAILKNICEKFQLLRLEELRQLHLETRNKITKPATITLGTSINTKRFSDKQFLVEGKILYAHRVVLCSRSDYFRNLFLSGMREAHELVTDLTASGVAFKTFSALLEFIYTDKVSGINPDLAIDLLILANEYLLPRLRRVCEDIVCDTGEIATENCIDIYKFSDLYQASRLKKISVGFIAEHLTELAGELGFGWLNQLELRSVREILSHADPLIARIYDQYLKILEHNSVENLQKERERLAEKERNSSAKFQKKREQREKFLLEKQKREEQKKSELRKKQEARKNGKTQKKANSPTTSPSKVVAAVSKNDQPVEISALQTQVAVA